ncbi:hypothetical protein E2320_016266 [Naja naja]|nr:hypothetical protein E2320_016266 [Naja naja]
MLASTSMYISPKVPPCQHSPLPRAGPSPHCASMQRGSPWAPHHGTSNKRLAEQVLCPIFPCPPVPLAPSSSSNRQTQSLFSHVFPICRTFCPVSEEKREEAPTACLEMARWLRE